MAGKKRSSPVAIRSLSGWRIVPISVVHTGRRSEVATDPFVDKLLREGRLDLEQAVEATTEPRRDAGDESLTFEVDVEAEADLVTVARHPSGAITFHLPEAFTERRGRSARTSTRTVRFHISVNSTGAADGTGRRGVTSKILRIFVMKVVGKIVDLALPKLSEAWEKRVWKNRHRGLLKVTHESLATGELMPLRDSSTIASAPSRNLLLIHGTLSHAEVGFAGLARTVGTDGHDFFKCVEPIYGDRLFAFNHFTVSESPEQNARMLLESLPARAARFDVVTHSRGALVLRTIIEQRALLGSIADRFQLGHAILVAGPNQGTPLASPARWETLTGWLANLLELFPSNPFTFGISFISDALGWIAKRAGGSLPGIAAMNPDGDLITSLQSEAPPPTGSMSALVTNYEPDSSVWARMADAGVDFFFSMANDLVVPTEGGWLIDRSDTPAVPGTQIGCYGPGGNLRSDGLSQVSHCNFFDQPETIDFLVRTLSGTPLGLKSIDPKTLLPYRRTRGGSVLASPTQARMSITDRVRVDVAASTPTSEMTGRSTTTTIVSKPDETRIVVRGRGSSNYPTDDVLHLLVLDPAIPDDERTTDTRWIHQPSESGTAAKPMKNGKNQEDGPPRNAVIIASFRNARVVEPFYLRGGDAGRRFKDIIGTYERIRRYIDGANNVKSLPTAPELVNYGCTLFETLFPGQVKRLYDAARAETLGRRLDVIFTSTIGWVADKPWEFAFDPTRRMFLCVEEINFIRNVLTAVPAEALPLRSLPLRILVVAAQPIGAAPLSEEEEIAVILRGFRPLIDAGLAQVEIVVAATPAILHERLESSAYEGTPFDVLHFIGHGEYRRQEGMGYLLFENDRGGIEPLRADIFRQIVARRGIRLVFLNACETGAGISGTDPARRNDFSAGVAPLLVAGGVPAVVANQFKVLDPSAAAFAQHFYWALAQGRGIGDAAREARVSVNYSITGEAIDWAVPVVFARNPGDRLVMEQSQGQTGPMETIRRRTAERRTAAYRRIRVALWDINHVVPTLEDVTARFNAAQHDYSFEVVDISAPLGTWRLRPSKTEDEPAAYLDANEVERKLADTPTRLGVDRLFCLTNFWLSGDGIDNLIAHSNDDDSIVIVSSAGILDDLRPPETSVERFVSNLVAGFLSGIDAHELGKDRKKNCPVYYNGGRDVRLAAGQLRFCPDCLGRINGDLKKPLESILRAFDAT